MRAVRQCVAIAVALAPWGFEAAAQDRVIRRDTSGAWEVEESARGSEPNLCMMSSSTPDGRSFAVTFLGGANALTVVVSSRGWRIPSGLRVPIRYWIDGNTPWNAQAQASRDGQALVFTTGRDTMSEWERQWRLGAVMTISFPQGNEAPWRFTLTGTNAATSLFVACMARANATARAPGAPAQPHAGPSQPFSAPAPQPVPAPPSPAGPPTKGASPAPAPMPGPGPAPSPMPAPAFQPRAGELRT
jgi:hypothetical protein